MAPCRNSAAKSLAERRSILEGQPPPIEGVNAASTLTKLIVGDTRLTQLSRDETVSQCALPIMGFMAAATGCLMLRRAAESFASLVSAGG